MNITQIAQKRFNIDKNQEVLKIREELKIL